MKVTFLTPPVLKGNRPTERVAGCTYTLYPVPNIYELTVAANVQRTGADVRVVESVLFGWDRMDFVQFLYEDDSDLYAIYTVNLGIDNDIEARRMIAEHRPDANVMFLGPAPTYYADRFLGFPGSFVVRGEPDETARELVAALQSGADLSNILGLSWRSNGQTYHNDPRPLIKDLDSLPFPGRDLIPVEHRAKYCNPKLALRPYTAVVTSRNCPYRCIYCVPSSLSFARELEYKKHNDGKKPPVGKRSVENVCDELEMLAGQGYKAVSFQDDNFIWTPDRTIAIAKKLKELGMVWGCQSRADRINEDVAAAMADSSCKYVDIGVESFDQGVLDYVKKDLQVHDMVKAIKLLKRHRINAKINVLLGTSPLETKETIRLNSRMIKELHVDQVMFSIATPFPGTEFYDLAMEHGWFDSGDYQAVDVQKSAICSFPNLSSDELVREVNRANRRFFLSPRFVAKNITRFRSLSDFKSAGKALYRKLWV